MERPMQEILRELRTNKKLTQSDMAKLLGLTTNAYQSYERGTSEPSCKALRKLADFYNVTTDYLLGREPKTDPIAQLDISEVEKRIIEKYVQFPESTRDELINVLRQLAAASDDDTKPPGEMYVTTQKTAGEILDERADQQAETEDGAG